MSDGSISIPNYGPIIRETDGNINRVVDHVRGNTGLVYWILDSEKDRADGRSKPYVDRETPRGEMMRPDMDELGRVYLKTIITHGRHELHVSRHDDPPYIDKATGKAYDRRRYYTVKMCNYSGGVTVGELAQATLGDEYGPVIFGCNYVEVCLPIVGIDPYGPAKVMDIFLQFLMQMRQ